MSTAGTERVAGLRTEINFGGKRSVEEHLCQYRRGVAGRSHAWGVVENAEGGWNEGGVPPICKIDFRAWLRVSP